MTDLKTFYNKKYKNLELRSMSDLRFKKTLQQFEKYVDIAKNWTMLDIGCGIGKFMEMAPFKYKIGVDLAENALVKAREKGLEEVYQCDIETDKLPIFKNSIDVVFCMEVFEHLLFETNAMTEIKRVLKNKGYLVVTVPNDVLRFDTRIGILFGRMFRLSEPYPYDNQHIRYFNSETLKMLLNKYNFRIVYNGALPLSYKQRRLGWLGAFLSDNLTNLLPSTYSIIGQNVRNR